MSLTERAGSRDHLREEFIEELADRDEAVDINHLLDETSADNRREAKQVLRKMMDQGLITTTPGFKYKLASDASASA
ncbi:hypothetical protein [Halosimplex marinum]|uniref:hypothetical protein n=1 Tax=Halosimplex marinum TaxID=3396620 RepID=UPI003F56441E